MYWSFICCGEETLAPGKDEKCEILVQTLTEGKNSFVRVGRRLEGDDIEMDVKEIRTGLNWLKIRSGEGFF
jgi:hypothetical protein